MGRVTGTAPTTRSRRRTSHRPLHQWLGRQGDYGLIAESEDGQPIGAAWYRLFSAPEPGYGHISSAIPEITVAVRPGYRRQGTGSALLAVLVRLARDSGFVSLSLSVEKRNPAVSLYERHGFSKVGISGESWTMRLDIIKGPS